MAVLIRRLEERDEVAAFDCGDEALNNYLKRHAWANQQKSSIGVTYVALDETIARIPIDPVPICVRNDAAASHSVCNSKCDFEGFGNESMPKTLS